jgi:hypothetical protein
MNARTALLAVAALAAACSPPRIPGTEIRSTPDTRAVYDVVQAYRAALEARDAGAVLALVAPNYYDTNGTPDPSDDLDRAGLEASLVKDLPRAEGLKVDFTVRKIEVDGDEAQVEIFYEQFYRVKTNTVVVPRRDADLQRMKLHRFQGAWKFVSGL